MSWRKKVNLKKFKQKAEKAIITDVEKQLDRIRDNIFIESQKMGGWDVYISSIQKQKKVIFSDPRI